MGEQLKQQPAFDVATEKDVKNIYHVDRYVSGTEGPTGVYESRRITEQQLKEVIGSLFNLLGTTDPALDTLVADIVRSGRIFIEQDSENKAIWQFNGANIIGNAQTSINLATASNTTGGAEPTMKFTRWRGTYLSPLDLQIGDAIGKNQYNVGVSSSHNMHFWARATENHIDGVAYGMGYEFFAIPNGSTTSQKVLKIDGDGKVSFLNYNFPILDGSPNQVLKTDGSGNLIWENESSGGLTGSGQIDKIAIWSGSNNIQYNTYYEIQDGSSPIVRLSSLAESSAQFSGVSGFTHNSNSFAQLVLRSNTDVSYPQIRLQRFRGNINSFSTVLNGDVLGKFNFASYQDASLIESLATETHISTTNLGSKLSFKTVKTGEGSNDLNERLSIEGDGKVRIAEAYKLPDTDGSANQVLKTDGSGNLNFSTLNERDVQVRTVTGATFTGATFDFLCSNYLIAEYTADTLDVTVTFNTPQEGQTYSMVFIQSASLIDLTLPTGYWLNDVAPFGFSTELASGERAMITATYLNSTWYFASKKMQLV